MVGYHIQNHFKDWSLWIPTKDVGVDFLVTNRDNHRSASLQVKYGKDFLPGKPKDLQKQFRCLSWFTLDEKKLDQSHAEFWVFVLHSFTSDNPDFVVIPKAELRQLAKRIQVSRGKMQVYLSSTKDRCWQTRGLGLAAMRQLAAGAYRKPIIEFTPYLNDNGWAALARTLNR